MKETAGSFRGSARRIVVAVVVGLAVVTAMSTGDETKAQSLQLPSVKLPAVQLPGAGTAQQGSGLSVPSIQVPPIQVQVPPVSVPGTPVKTPQVTVQTPQVTTPSVQAPALPAAPIRTPSVPAPSVPTPSVQTPKAPALPDVRVPSVRSGGSGAGGDSTSPSPSARQGSAPAMTPGGSAGAGAGAGTAAAAATASLDLPSANELRRASPARRRLIMRRLWERPLRGERLRRLRETLLDYQGCLGGLPDQGRRTLVLRAGLNGAEPTSRRVIARRLGISLGREVRVERGALRRLTNAGRQGLCGDGGTGGVAGSGGVAGHGSVPARGAPATPLAATIRKSDEPTLERGGVLGVADRGGSAHRVPRLDLGDGADGVPGALFFLALVLLGPLAAAIFATRRHRGSAVIAAPATTPGERPLLFLDVDGVLALSPTASKLSSGRTYELGFGAVYVSDQTRLLVRALAARFELVWATGWEHQANRGLLTVLGLEDELPVLTFGDESRHGSAESKTSRVDAYAGDRPTAWIDNGLDQSHDLWAIGRSAPTLLVSVDPREGISPGDVRALLEWADGLREQDQGAPDRAASRSRS